MVGVERPQVDREGRRRGSGASKKCTGKLLEIPPSENQQRSAPALDRVRRRGGLPGRSRAQARQAWSAPGSRLRLASMLQSGTALSRTGKLRLIRVATITGRSPRRGQRAQRCEQRAAAAPTPALGARSSGRRRRVSLHPRDDPLREQLAELVRVGRRTPALPREPVRAAVREVRRHQLRSCGWPRRAEIAERRAARRPASGPRGRRAVREPRASARAGAARRAPSRARSRCRGIVRPSARSDAHRSRPSMAPSRTGAGRRRRRRRRITVDSANERREYDQRGARQRARRERRSGSSSRRDAERRRIARPPVEPSPATRNAEEPAGAGLGLEEREEVVAARRSTRGAPRACESRPAPGRSSAAAAPAAAIAPAEVAADLRAGRSAPARRSRAGRRRRS